MPCQEHHRISVCVLTLNEGFNIAKCLTSLTTQSTDVWVIDSQSTDQTEAIAVQYGAKVLVHNCFDWASQRNWALDNASFENEWVLFIDADEEMTPECWAEVTLKVSRAPADVHAFKILTSLRFLGARIPHAYNHPPVVRLVRRTKVRWQGVGAREYAKVTGTAGTISSRLPHEDLRGLKYWLTKHIKNAEREAKHELAPSIGAVDYSTVTKGQRLRLFLRTRIWIHLPPVPRSVMYFIYRYVLCGGFLDGRPGFYFCFLHGLWYPIVIAALEDEQRIAARLVPADERAISAASPARDEDPN